MLGLQGLNIVGVAEDAGISHATLIHHFGSTGEMRSSLVDHMTERLGSDVMQALDQEVPPQQLFEDLFQTLSDGGHAKLLAWMAVEEGRQSSQSAETQQIFDALIQLCTDRLELVDVEQVRNIVLMVAATAIGLSIASTLPSLIGMDKDALETFPRWLAGQVEFLQS